MADIDFNDVEHMAIDFWMCDKDGNVTATRNLIEWSKWREANGGLDLKTSVRSLQVSTVFLPTDMNFGIGGGPPVLWETMVFPTEIYDYQERYTSQKDAIKGHRKAVRMLREKFHHG